MWHDLSHLGSLILIRIIPKERTLRNLRNISGRFFENQPNEIYSHLSEKASKGRFLKPEKLQNHSNEGKGKEKKKERGEEKKAMVTLLVIIIATLEIVFGRKKLLDAKGPFGDDVFKNPARYIYIALSIKI